ncbi:uncharacterized protein METZ01_LOCUS131274 [marine metagenome]|uniref:Luciferase-like domain-containing protein n=1 Tax=marine metagenome TaxID=408172 RepID=A0A381YN89_9ZZZZ
MVNSTITFGLQSGQQDSTWADIRDLWLELEEMNFDHLWVYDHYLPTGTNDIDVPVLDSWSLLAALSQIVKTPRLGTLVTSNTFRHPVTLAKMITSLDHISNGRAILGIGAGWHKPEHTAYAIPFSTPKDRIERLDETIQIIKQLWSNKRTTISGKHFKIDNAPFEPKTVQKPHPPILIGGGGEKHTLRIVAKHADDWNWNLNGTINDYKRKLDILNQHCAAVSRDPNEIKLSLNVDFLVDNDDNRIESALRVNADVMKKSIEEVKACSMVGSPEVVRSKIQSYVDLGVTSFIFSLRNPFGVKSTDQMPNKEPRPLRYHATMSDVRRLCQYVLPHFRN